MVPFNERVLSASCKSQNLIYLLTCNKAGEPATVGETATKLNMRMNTHRTSTTGCEHVYTHKKECVGFDFLIQVLEKLAGTGYDVDGLLNSNITKFRQTREDFWIKRLRTLFPYGLNEKALDKISDSTIIRTAVGSLNPPLDKNIPRPVRTRKKDKNYLIDSIASLFRLVGEWFEKDPATLYNNIRKTLNTLSRKLLRLIASEIQEPNSFAFQ